LDAGVEGSHRFLRRLWAAAVEYKAFIEIGQNHIFKNHVDWNKVPDEHKNLRREIHSVLKQANFDIDRHQFNTVASACMKMLNAFDRLPGALNSELGEDVVLHGSMATSYICAEGFSFLLRILYPIAPHMTHALWKELGYGDDILNAGWPIADEAAMVQDTVEYVVQVNGKLRGNLTASREASKEAIEKMVLEQTYVTKFLLEGTSVRKIIVVPNKLVNVVIA